MAKNNILRIRKSEAIFRTLMMWPSVLIVLISGGL